MTITPQVAPMANQAFRNTPIIFFFETPHCHMLAVAAAIAVAVVENSDQISL